MRLRNPFRLGVMLLYGILAPLWLASCVSDSGPGAPVFGSITIITVTTGPAPDPDGYSVLVDGEEVDAIGANATLTLSNFAPQTYSVELSGVADHCVVLDETTQDVPVEPDAITEVTFELDCSEPLPATPVARLTITDENERSVNEDGRLEATAPAGTFASFTFDASRSEPGAGSSITAYEWLSNGVLIGTRESFLFALDEGEYLISLTVTNGAGLSETASATIVITE